MPVLAAAPPKLARLRSLDVLRGATIAGMILVNNPGSWGHIHTPLKHAPWHGCTPTDLVFPFFLFTRSRAQGAVLLVCLLRYWPLLTLVSLPGHCAPDIGTQAHHIAAWVDRAVLEVLYRRGIVLRSDERAFARVR